MRYCDKVGYRRTYEVLDENGDGTGVSSRNSNGESINDNSLLSNSISIIGNPFALTNFTSIIWIEHLGVKWKVSSVDVTNYPRMVFSLGGVWNETET